MGTNRIFRLEQQDSCPVISARFDHHHGISSSLYDTNQWRWAVCTVTAFIRETQLWTSLPPNNKKQNTLNWLVKKGEGHQIKEAWQKKDIYTRQGTFYIFSPTRPHWAELVIESPCPSVCLCVCAIGCSFFRCLSLALRSQDQFQASHWSLW